MSSIYISIYIERCMYIGIPCWLFPICYSPSGAPSGPSDPAAWGALPAWPMADPSAQFAMAGWPQAWPGYPCNHLYVCILTNGPIARAI